MNMYIPFEQFPLEAPYRMDIKTYSKKVARALHGKSQAVMKLGTIYALRGLERPQKIVVWSTQ